MPLTSIRLRAAGLLLLVVAAGCSTRRSDVTFHEPSMDFSLVQTVAVVPFTNLSNTTLAADRVRDVLSTMLQASGALYVLPPGEVARGVARSSVDKPSEPSADEIVKLGQTLGADAVITGTVREYGEIRSGTTSANVISISLQMFEAGTGRLVWSASSTKGGVGAADRLFGGGGKPMNVVTQEAIKDLLDKLFRG